jgi:hypothetical protein
MRITNYNCFLFSDLCGLCGQMYTANSLFTCSEPSSGSSSAFTANNLLYDMHNISRLEATFLLAEFIWCCSCRWGETMSLNCGHQETYCSFPMSYVSMKCHGGLTDRGKPNNSEEKNEFQCHSVQFHMDWPGSEPGRPRREASDYPPEPWHGLYLMLIKISGETRLAVF